MATLDREGLDSTFRDSNRRLGLSERHLMLLFFALQGYLLRMRKSGNAENRNPWVIKFDEDWGADLSPCNFATTPFPADRSSFIAL